MNLVDNRGPGADLKDLSSMPLVGELVVEPMSIVI